MKISVVTPSIRPEGLKIVEKALKNQTFKDYEWLVNSDKYEGGFWGLNRAYNDLFRKAKGELIVTLQDWIYVDPEGLQKFWDAYEAYPKAVVSGVGDQYETTDKWGKPQIKIWSDPRKRMDQGSFYECYPNDAEWNWCAIPKKLLYDVGGMDEELDFLGYGGDQLQVGERLDAIGVKFYLDQTNESYTIRHDRSSFGGQENWDKNHVLFNGKYEKRKIDLVKEGKWPKLSYLQRED
jgi:hypothetical protein